MTERRPWIETITDDLLPAPGVLRQMSECYDTTADQLPAVRQLAARVAATKAGRDWLLDPAVVAQYQPRGRGWPRGKPRKKPERTGEAPCPGL